MNYINPHEFYLETNGKLIDVDKQHGGQCWDLFAYFTLKYCGRTFSCPYSGYVKDFYYHFKELGLDKYFDLITNRYELQDGDWLIWDKAVSPHCWISQFSHIAMFRKYEKGQEQNIILTQNPNGNPNYTHQMLCDFHGFVGALRPLTNVKKANITKFEIPYIDTNYVKVAFETDMPVDFAMYSLNGLEYVNLPISNVIDNLKEGMKYTLSIKLRTQGTNEWTISDTLEFTTLEIKEETPQISTKGEDSTNTLPNTEITENGTKNEELDHKENPLVEFAKFLIEFIRKYFMKGDK